MYPMPYACLLASCSMNISYALAPAFCFSVCVSPPSLLFYLVCFPIEPWDSLSGYVPPGIACLAFQASDWLGAFWTSLPDYPPLLGVYPT